MRNIDLVKLKHELIRDISEISHEFINFNALDADIGIKKTRILEKLDKARENINKRLDIPCS